MSLVGFHAQNHPQQQTSGQMLPSLADLGSRVDRVDDRAIRDADWEPLHARFRFTIDAAASAHNAKLPRYWTLEDDSLSQSWKHERVWCNPPYSNISPWVDKAWTEWGKRLCPDLIVMLLPANRTEQLWWQNAVEPLLREQRGDFHCEFLAGRMRFDRPGAVIGPKGDRPPFGCCLLIWGSP